jgi:hypothetical protein
MYLAVAGLVATAGADTLVMRDGRRIPGELVSVRDGVVEFEGRRGVRGRDRLRVDRFDVVRIELDDAAPADVGSGGRPAGLRERSVSVSARQPWTDPGIDVRAGQVVYFSATGRVRWGPGRQDGAAGEGNSPYNPTRPIPGRPAAGLIGRVGESNDYFFIGDDQGPIRMRSSGRLFLGLNDDVLDDNSGSLRVTIAY